MKTIINYCTKLKHLGVFVLLLVTMLVCQQAEASHLAGGDMEYRCIGLRRWEIRLVVYRDCVTGIPMPNCTSGSQTGCSKTLNVKPMATIAGGGLNPNGCTAPVATMSVIVTTYKIESIGKSTQGVCGLSAKNTCTNNATTGAGSYTPAVEGYYYLGILDMSSPAFAAANVCPYWEVSWEEAARNSGITNIPATNFYVRSVINIHYNPGSGNCANSSPQFKNEAVAIVCSSMENVFNVGAVDPDRDSLTYKLAKAKTSGGVDINYLSPWSEFRPFPLNGGSAPHTSFPQPNGPYVILDTINGDISFNAVNSHPTNIIFGQLNVDIYQWNYRADGTPYVVGITQRDIQMYVRSCPANIAPKLMTNPTLPNGNPKYNWSVCAGEQLCFTITATDDDDGPEPKPSPKQDTTYISWNEGIVRPGKLTFLPDYNPNAIPKQRPREDRWRFCWQTVESDGSTLPYYFTVTGMDNHCPNVGRVTRAFGITVVPMPVTIDTIVDNKCGKYRYTVWKKVPKHTFSYARLDIAKEPYDYSFTWGTYATIGTPNPPSVPGNPTAPRVIMSDTLHFTKGGRYLVKYEVRIPGVEPGQSCTRFFYDTIIVDTPVQAFNRDTFVCKFSNMPIIGSAKWGTPPYTYRWFRNDTLGTPVNGPNYQTAHTYISSDTQNTRYILRVQDLRGCYHIKHMDLEVRQLPKPLFAADTARICSYEDFTLDAGNNNGNIKRYEWFKNSVLVTEDTLQSVVKKDSGTYVIIHTDTSGCRNSDTFRLYVNEPVLANAGVDTLVCQGDSVMLKATGGHKYKWDRIQGTNLVNVLPYSGRDTLKAGMPNNAAALSFTDYVVTAYYSYPNPAVNHKECLNIDTVRITTRVFPILGRPAQRNICTSVEKMILPTFGITPLSQTVANGGVGTWTYNAKPSALFTDAGFPSIYIDSMANIPRDTSYLNQANNITASTRTNWIKFTYKGPVDQGGCVKVDSAAIRLFALPKVDAKGPVQRCDNAGIYPLNPASGLHDASPRDSKGRDGVWSMLQGDGLVKTIVGSDTIFNFNPKLAGVLPIPQVNKLMYTYTMNYNTTPQTSTLPCVNVDTLEIRVIKPPIVDAGVNISVCKNDADFGISTKSGATSNSTIPGSTIWKFAPLALQVGTPKPPVGPAILDAITNNNQNFNPKDVDLPATKTVWKLYYEDNSSGCLAQDSIELTLWPKPVVALSTPKPEVCKTDMPLQLITTPAATLGTFSGTAILNTGLFNMQSPLVAGESSYTFMFKHTDVNGCTDSATTSVFVQTPPTINVANVAPKCDYDTVPFKLSATVTPTSRYGLLWSTDGTGTLSAPDQPNTDYKFTAADAAVRFINVTATSAATMPGTVCPATSSSIQLDINPRPNPDFVYDSAGCEPYTANFAAKGAQVGNSTYAWFFAGVPANLDSSFTHEFTKWGDVPIKLIVSTPANCTAEKSGLVKVHSKPIAFYISDPKTTSIVKPYFNFDNKSQSPDGSSLTYLWNFGPDPAIQNSTADRLITTESPREVLFGQVTGKFDIPLVATSEYGCIDTFVDQVEIEPDITVFIPSAFRPIEGGNNVPCADVFTDCNDVFRVYAKGFETIEVYVFNRWGQQVFSTNNPDVGWNGKINNDGAICPQDVYIYQVNATSFSKKKYNYSGSVTLLR